MNRSQKVIVRCFIAQLEGVEGHAVYLAIDRNGEIELTVVSLHSTVIKAWSVAVAARRILENSSYSYQYFGQFWNRDAPRTETKNPWNFNRNSQKKALFRLSSKNRRT